MKFIIVYILLCVVSCMESHRLIKKIKDKLRKHEEKSEYNCDYKADQKLVDEHLAGFRLMDRDGNGAVTPQEIVDTLSKVTDDVGRKEFDISKEVAVEMVKTGDQNKDGKLTEKEWIKMFLKQAIDKYAVEFRDHFELFDRNGNLAVTKRELALVFARANVKNPEELSMKIIERFECDGDEQLGFSEFVGYLAFSKLKSNDE